MWENAKTTETCVAPYGAPKFYSYSFPGLTPGATFCRPGKPGLAESSRPSEPINFAKKQEVEILLHRALTENHGENFKLRQRSTRVY